MFLSQNLPINSNLLNLNHDSDPSLTQETSPKSQEINYGNNNANALPNADSGAPPVTNLNVTWTVQLGPTPDFAEEDNVGSSAKDNLNFGAKDNVDVADTDDERVVERWEPGEIIDGDGDDELFRGGGEDFLGRRTRSSQRRRRMRRRERQSAQVQLSTVINCSSYHCR